MAKPTDRVQLRKNESAAGGGDPADDDLGFPATLDAAEDAPEVQGLFFQPQGGPADEEAWITRDGGGNLLFRDENNTTERTLTQLASGDLAALLDIAVIADGSFVVVGNDIVVKS